MIYNIWNHGQYFVNLIYIHCYNIFHSYFDINHFSIFSFDFHANSVWGCVQKATHIEHVFPLAILDFFVWCDHSNLWVDFFGWLVQRGKFNVVFPKRPAPNLLSFRFDLLMCDFGIFPCFTVIEGDLHDFDFRSFGAIASGPTFQRQIFLVWSDRDCFIVQRLCDAGICHIAHNWRIAFNIDLRPVGLRYDLIVSSLHMWFCLFIWNFHFANPFGMSDSDVPWHHQSQRISMVSSKLLAILRVGQNDFIRSIKNPTHWDWTWEMDALKVLI